MGKATKTWLIIGICLILAGVLLLGSALYMLRWDFSKLFATKFNTNSYVPDSNFQDITIMTDTADVEFLPSDKCKVVCYEPENMTHHVTVSDGTLRIEIHDTRKWYEQISLFSPSQKITVYLPEGEYGALSVQADTGDVKLPAGYHFENAVITLDTGDILVENSSAKAMTLSASTGKITLNHAVCEGDLQVEVSTGKTILSDSSCKNLTATGDTGDIALNRVNATEKISIERTTGDVNFDSCDAKEIYVQTDTGSVKGSLLSEKIFIAESDTGWVNVPNSVGGGKCEIHTDTGNIHITVVKEQ